MIIEMKAEHIEDINKGNEPFMVVGRIIPKYENDTWIFTELLYEEPYEKSYPNGDEDYNEHINKSMVWAKQNNLYGLMLETQDNNLLACKFYLKCGF